MDIEYGKVAEADFETVIVPKVMDKGYNVFDVRDFPEYQKKDVDYVIDTEGAESLPSIKEVISNRRYIKIEVKLDSRGLETGNFPYELESHSNAGWCVVTKCDYIYLALTERDKDTILKRCWINKEKWDDYCANRSIKKRTSRIEDESITDLLCNMSDMERSGVLEWINT